MILHFNLTREIKKRSDRIRGKDAYMKYGYEVIIRNLLIYVVTVTRLQSDGLLIFEWVSGPTCPLVMAQFEDKGRRKKLPYKFLTLHDRALHRHATNTLNFDNYFKMIIYWDYWDVRDRLPSPLLLRFVLVGIIPPYLLSLFNCN